MKKIGILGGMGPVATLNFYKLIVEYAQKNYNAVQDIDFPPMFLYSLPLYGFGETGIIDKLLVLNQLEEGVNVLEKAGCDFIVIPCNTVHCFIDQLRAKASVPILSIIEETVSQIKSDKICSAALIGSETTMRLGLYDEKLKQIKIKFSAPNKSDYPKITSLILAIMGGKPICSEKEEVIKIIEKKQAESVVLACTELPSAISQDDLRIKVYDSLSILAKSALEFSRSSLSSPRKTPLCHCPGARCGGIS
jgi:aspartate racemase